MKYEIIAIGMIVAIGLIFGGVYYSTQEDVTITVSEKTTKYHDGDEKYLVHSANGETFEVTDAWVFFRFDSSDTYFSLEEGETYNCKVAGWRVPFLSWYRNIITAEEVAGTP